MQAITMSPYYLWQSGSSGSVWRQTSQTGGVFLMMGVDYQVGTIVPRHKFSKRCPSFDL